MLELVRFPFNRGALGENDCFIAAAMLLTGRRDTRSMQREIGVLSFLTRDGHNGRIDNGTATGTARMYMEMATGKPWVYHDFNNRTKRVGDMDFPVGRFVLIIKHPVQLFTPNHDLHAVAVVNGKAFDAMEYDINDMPIFGYMREQ